MRTIPSLCAAGLILALSVVTGSRPGSAQEPPAWALVASEQLVRLPTLYLEKAVERDFRASALADALRDTAAQADGAATSLAALQAAAESASGTQRDEARHRFLVAKQDYVALMGARQDLERQRIETELGLYRRLLDRVTRNGAVAGDPALADLAERRRAAQQRLEASADSVDMKLFASATAEESRYGREYRRQAAAIDGLLAAIAAHPMNEAPVVDGRDLGKADYLGHLIAEAESRLALLDQKDLVLSYMAKLVALDAMALADDVEARDPAHGALGGGPDAPRDVSAAVDFFTVRP